MTHKKHWIEGLGKKNGKRRKPSLIGKAEAFRGGLGGFGGNQSSKASERYTAKKKIVMGVP